MKKEWQNLYPAEKITYLEKAKYLLDRGFVMDKSEEQLAEQIYISKRNS